MCGMVPGVFDRRYGISVSRAEIPYAAIDVVEVLVVNQRPSAFWPVSRNVSSNSLSVYYCHATTISYHPSMWPTHF